VEVENFSDELCLGVKGQSSRGIAGSPRKIFRYRLEQFSSGGRALTGLGVSPDYQTLLNSEYRKLLSREAVMPC
jgi:hypothetical protein